MAELIDALGFLAFATQRTVAMNIFAILVVIAAVIAIIFVGFPQTRKPIAWVLAGAAGGAAAFFASAANYFGGF